LVLALAAPAVRAQEGDKPGPFDGPGKPGTPGEPGAPGRVGGEAGVDLPPAPALGKAATEAIHARYLSAEHWVQKAVLLLSLNHYWHPVGSEMVLDALRSKDLLPAFGVESLLRCQEGLLPSVVSHELLDELISGQLDVRQELFRKRLLEVLPRIVPDAAAETRADWEKWWRGAKDTWQPAPWKPATVEPASSKTVVSVADRAFDLYDRGLDLTICIDSTGSMQPTIDALAEALGQMVDILRGISPKFRLGLAHYKDEGELGKTGAKPIQPLTRNIAAAQKQLQKLRAFGGGDLPEAVLGGLELALSRAMRWQPEANKLVILIGDAPPHDRDTEKVIELARSAHKDPGGVPGRPTTGPRSKDIEPFVVSAIGVFVKLGAGLPKPQGYDQFLKSQETMREDFGKIAQAGGGVFVDVEFLFTKPLAASASERREKSKEAAETIASQATRKIVEHVLVLSFGSKFAREMREFVRIYYDYQ
jgi:hypothetical protein